MDHAIDSNESHSPEHGISSTLIDKAISGMVLADKIQEVDDKINGRRLQRKSKTNCAKFIGEMAHKGGKGYNPRESPPESSTHRRSSLDSPKRKTPQPQKQQAYSLKKKLESQIGIPSN